MKQIKKISHNLAVGFLLAAATSMSSAAVINFQTLADSTLGESIWNPLTITVPGPSGFTLTITATKNSALAYAYLDSGTAGLGVCGTPTSSDAVNHSYGGSSGTNRCNPSDDDNVTAGEKLTFTFDRDVVINDIWMNDNHDPDLSLFNNTVDINGSAHTFLVDHGAGSNNDYNVGTSYSVLGNTAFTIGYYSGTLTSADQFYISKMSVTAVPEPEIYAMLGLGLGMMGWVGRRRIRGKA